MQISTENSVRILSSVKIARISASCFARILIQHFLQHIQIFITSSSLKLKKKIYKSVFLLKWKVQKLFQMKTMRFVKIINVEIAEKTTKIT